MKKVDGSGFLTVNKGGISYLKDAEVELTVTEESMTEIMRDKKYNQLVQAGKDDPFLVQSTTFRKLKLEAMDITFADKQKIMKEADEQQAQQQQMAENAQGIAAEKNQLKYGKESLDQEEQEAKIQESASKAGATSK